MYGSSNHNPNRDIEVASPPNDCISQIVWSPRANFIAASSWDNSIRCWEVQASGQTVPKGSINHQAPALCCTWSGDGAKIFSGGCDNKAIGWDLQTGQSMPVGEHQGPIKIIGWIEEMKMLMTGSWDKTIKYWDLRTNNAVGTLMLPERAYCADFTYPLAVICTAERHIGVIDLTKPDKFYRTFQSPLKYQSRSITCFPDKSGFALGSIEGRVAIHHVEEKDNVKNFAFKCHRENNGSEIYAVNALAFNKQFGTFATCGSDGSYHFWDKDSKTRLKAFQRCSLPVTSAAFNGDGTIFAYSIGYDWSKGAEYYNPNTMKNYILLHAVQEAEVKARAGQAGNNQQRRK